MSAVEADIPQEEAVLATPLLPPGVFVGGPMVRAKLRETYLLFGILYAGSIAGIAWAFWQGIDRGEIAVFAAMFALTTFGIGAGMHRLLVHRSFRCGPVMRTFFCAIAQMAVQGSLLKWVANHRRHHLYADDVGDPHSPHYNGRGYRHKSLMKAFLHSHRIRTMDDSATEEGCHATGIMHNAIVTDCLRSSWIGYAVSAARTPGA